MPPDIQAFDHIHVMVSDRPAAEAWYARVLGLKRVPELAVWAADGGPLTLGDASNQIHLALFERPPQACRSTIALRVSAQAFVAWQAHLEAELGMPPELEDHDLSWSLYFSDPDGNPFEITTYEYKETGARLHGAANGA